MAENRKGPAIAFDLDGTITKSKSWVPSDKLELIDGVYEAIWKFKELGYRIIIYTARFDSQYFTNDEVITEVRVVTEFLNKNNIPFDELALSGKPVCEIYFDDKAIHFNGNWSDALLEAGRRLDINIW